MDAYIISRREAADGSISPDIGGDTVWRVTGETFVGTPEDLATYVALRQTQDGWPYRGVAG
jgi:hypothetical protein